MMIVAGLYDALLLTTFIIAMTWGGTVERIAAITILIASVATIILQFETALRFRTLSPALLTIDAAATMVFVIMAAKSRLYWPLWAAAFQVLGVAADIGPSLTRTPVWNFAYALTEQVWGWLTLCVILVATLMRRQAALRRARNSRPS